MRLHSNRAINKTNTLRIRRVHIAHGSRRCGVSSKSLSHMNKLARTYRIDYARLRTAASL